MEEIKKSDRTHKGFSSQCLRCLWFCTIYMLLPPHHSQELGSPGGRNMAVSLGLGKRLLLPWMKSQGFSWMYLACFCPPVILNPFCKYLLRAYQWSHLLLGRTYGKRPKNAQTHRPFLKPHLVATWLSQKGLRYLLILRRAFLPEDFGPGLWGSGLSCPLQHLTINISISGLKALSHKR